MNPSYDFAGQVALVTGAAVVLVDRNEKAVQQAANQLDAAGYNVLAIACDVTDEGQAAAAVAHTVERFGRLDMA